MTTSQKLLGKKKKKKALKRAHVVKRQGHRRGSKSDFLHILLDRFHPSSWTTTGPVTTLKVEAGGHQHSARGHQELPATTAKQRCKFLTTNPQSESLLRMRPGFRST